jgi:hypothetical protein
MKTSKKKQTEYKTFGVAIAKFWEKRGVNTQQWQLKGKKIVYGTKQQ